MHATRYLARTMKMETRMMMTIRSPNTMRREKIRTTTRQVKHLHKATRRSDFELKCWKSLVWREVDGQEVLNAQFQH